MVNGGKAPTWAIRMSNVDLQLVHGSPGEDFRAGAGPTGLHRQVGFLARESR